ncbi:Aste57867_9442 [Aphanomyces stellatus]|uniref:Aste57867_9442 protein n=1 Tax=Aphanomyces stellatus TaxID=120398 RepID=A0A485KMW3_9STRA|nr:hypothetical protein As57867_009406 [Aphanomyces stellatus]VFT86322.1 Aste57867_9442 [Aphanomyces stellatus]
MQTHFSIVCLGLDHNATMMEFNLSTKPNINRFAWTLTNETVFKQLQATYPTLKNIPTVFAIDRDSGTVVSPHAAVTIQSQPTTVLSAWQRGQNTITGAEARQWLVARLGTHDDPMPRFDILPHLPFETLVDGIGEPVTLAMLKPIVVVYFHAAWAMYDGRDHAGVGKFGQGAPGRRECGVLQRQRYPGLRRRIERRAASVSMEPQLVSTVHAFEKRMADATSDSLNILGVYVYKQGDAPLGHEPPLWHHCQARDDSRCMEGGQQ